MNGNGYILYDIVIFSAQIALKIDTRVISLAFFKVYNYLI